MARRIGSFHTFQTEGWLPGTKVSYYAERPVNKVGISIKTKHRKKTRRCWSVNKTRKK